MIHVELVITSLALTALWIGYHTLYRDLQIERSRHQLFKVRARLFDYAAQGQISFQEPAYVELRRMLNGMIRFTHRLTWFDTLSVALLYNVKKDIRRDVEQSRKQFTYQVARLAPDQQKMLKEIQLEMNRIAALHLLRSSLLLQSVLAMVAFIMKVVGAAQLVHRLRELFNRVIDYEAKREGARKGDSLIPGHC